MITDVDATNHVLNCSTETEKGRRRRITNCQWYPFKLYHAVLLRHRSGLDHGKCGPGTARGSENLLWLHLTVLWQRMNRSDGSAATENMCRTMRCTSCIVLAVHALCYHGLVTAHRWQACNVPSGPLGTFKLATGGGHMQCAKPGLANPLMQICKNDNFSLCALHLNVPSNIIAADPSRPPMID